MPTLAPVHAHGPVDVAADLLDRHGAADRILGVTVRAAADLAGVSRATVYRHWETATELNDELALVLGPERAGWTAAILDQPPGRPLARSLEHALGATANDLGWWARHAVAAWAPDAPGRRAVAAQEAAWLVRFRRWLDAHVAAQGRAWADPDGDLVAAVTVAVRLEGALLDAALVRPDGVVAPTPEDIPALAAEVARVVDVLTVEPSGPRAAALDAAAPPAPSRRSAPLPSGARAAILEAVVDAVADEPPWRSRLASSGRLVDDRRLAAALGVSVRRLHGTWPRAADFHADLLVGVVGRRRRQLERRGGAVLAREDLPQGAALHRLGRQVLHDFLVDPDGRGHPLRIDPMAAALIDPTPRAAVATACQAWRVAHRATSVATLSLAGWRPHPDLGPTAPGDGLLAFHLAAPRWVALHPEVAAPSMGPPAPTASVVARAVFALARSLADPADQAP